MFFKHKQVIHLVRDINGSVQEIAVKRISLSSDEVVFGDMSYPFNPDIPTYQRGLENHYFIDVDNGQSALNGSFPMDANYYNAVVTKKVGLQLLKRQVADGLNNSGMFPYIMLILGVGVGIMIGQFIELPFYSLGGGGEV